MGFSATCLALALLAANALPPGDVPEYKTSELPKLVGNIPVSFELLDERQVPITLSEVNQLTIVRVKPKKTSQATYDLRVYLDNSSLTTERNVSLPYDFQINCRGLREGAHKLILIFSGEGNDRAVATINLSVKHKLGRR
jgi:hypothetical protein